jgi:glucuronoarabinoxylan endo-1,4-beta-xylanase
VLALSLPATMTCLGKPVLWDLRTVGKSVYWLVLLASSGMSGTFGCGGSDETSGVSSGSGVSGSSSVEGTHSTGKTGLGGSSAATNSAGGAQATGGQASVSGSRTDSGTAAGGAATTSKSSSGGTAAGGAATGSSKASVGGAATTGGAATGGNAAGGAAAGGAAAGGKAAGGGATTPGGGRAARGGAGGASLGIGGKAAEGGDAAGGAAGATDSANGGATTTTAGSAGKTPGTAASGAATVDPSKEYQTMDGFGIADVWIGKATHTDALRKLFWDPVDGIGMSLLRVGIDSTGKIMGDAAFVDAPDVAKYGGKVWAAPWSPPANLKDNNNVNNGGHLNTASYDTWAATLAAFPAYFKQNTGVDLWGISAQNEPDYVASYQSCIFSASQMNAFIKVLGPKLAALNPSVKLIAAEPDVWSHTWNDGDKYGNAIEGDATVSSLVEIIATHDYGSNNKSYTRPSPPATLKHHLWETEIYYDEPKGSPNIDAGLALARGVYSGINGGGASGWHYWWTTHFMDGGSASSPPKRVYTMGNYSKFVRPGYIRVDITGLPSSLHATAFKNPADNTVVVVVLNETTNSVTLPLFVAGTSWPASVTPYVTDATNNLAAKTAITVTGGNFSASLGAQSVTTFVGKP